MIYTIEELKKIISPIASRYELPEVYLFGSYARNEATESSDVDVLINRRNSRIKGMFDMGALYSELGEALGKEIDLVTTDALEQPLNRQHNPWFAPQLYKERVMVYARQ